MCMDLNAIIFFIFFFLLFFFQDLLLGAIRDVILIDTFINQERFYEYGLTLNPA